MKTLSLQSRMIAQTAPSEPLITIKNVEGHYGNKHVLKNINTVIKKNCITGFIGPSGCGKTTLLRTLNRMNDLIDSYRCDGEILFEGDNILSQELDVIALRKKIGMVFQQPNPLPTTIYKNLRLPIVEHQKKLSKQEVDKLVRQKIEEVHLYEEVKNRLHRSALFLSGGQQQRLCIARALSITPEVLLFDEPCSALDPISTMKIEELLLELKEHFTIVIVTHNLSQALRIADDVCFFYEGEIVEQGEATALFGNPKHPLTQNYLTGRF